MESFLVYLFNFYYAISELEQNKQNKHYYFFFTISFFNKKVDLSSLRGGAGAPIAPPPLPTGLYINQKNFENLSTLVTLPFCSPELQGCFF